MLQSQYMLIPFQTTNPLLEILQRTEVIFPFLKIFRWAGLCLSGDLQEELKNVSVRHNTNHRLVKIQAMATTVGIRYYTINSIQLYRSYIILITSFIFKYVIIGVLHYE